jgi:hypothetical protein
MPCAEAIRSASTAVEVVVFPFPPLFSSLYLLALAEALETTKIHSVVFPCAMNYRNSGAQVLEMIGSL